MISDEELIEGAEFPARFGALSRHASLEVVEPKPFAEGAARPDADLLRELRAEIGEMNRVHARLSPVLQMQAWARGGTARKEFSELRLAHIHKLQAEHEAEQARLAALQPAEPPPPPAEEEEAVARMPTATELNAAAKTIQAHALRISREGYRVLVPDLYKGALGVNVEEAHHLMSNLDWDAATGTTTTRERAIAVTRATIPLRN